jgi:hypothetical protein
VPGYAVCENLVYHAGRENYYLLEILLRFPQRDNSAKIVVDKGKRMAYQR